MGRGTGKKALSTSFGLKDRGFTLTQMRPEDVDEISTMERDSFEFPWSKDSFREIVFSQVYKAIVVRTASNQIMGYTVYYTAADEGHIMNVVASSRYRRLGVANAMLAHIHGNLKKAGIKSVYLELRRSNYPAYRLYKKNGYVYIGIRKSYYADNMEDAVIMKKVLS